MKNKKHMCLIVYASTVLIFFLIFFSSIESVTAAQSTTPMVPCAFITNTIGGSVSKIDIENNTVISTVKVQNQPTGVVISPNGTKVYVVNLGSNSISVIDAATNTVTANVDVGKGPKGVAINPEGTKVYVTNGYTNTVSVIDTSTNNVIATVVVGGGPCGVAVNPDGTKAYVANMATNTVCVIDTATNIVTTTVPVGWNPAGVAVNPAGTKVYVTNVNSSTVAIIDTADNNVKAVNVGNGPCGVAVNTDGTKVYVANYGSNNVSVINTATDNVTATVNVGIHPSGVAVTSDGTKVYVANYGSNTVSVIDTATNNVTATVTVGIQPTAFGKFIGSVPVQDPTLPIADFNMNITSGYAPLTVQFTDSSQNAAGWNWDFGDGATSIDQNPSHTYPSEGTYNINLTVSNANGPASKMATIIVQSQSSSDGDNIDNSGGSSHSSGGGGGAGGSPEPQSNVEAKELSQTFIASGQAIMFDFQQKVTPVVSISFDSKKTTGKTTTIAEMLRNKSTLTSDTPTGEVYKYLNIWVGNGGFGVSNNIENAVISFKVEKSWIQDKKIDKSSITLNRYSNNTWNRLPASPSSEDDNYLYFKAQTPGFSPFAITGISNVPENKSFKPSMIETSTELTSSANEYTLGQPITFTATVKTASLENGTKVPSGTVTFIDGNASIGNGTGSLEHAVFTTSTLPVGQHLIIAHYSGDNNFKPSNSLAFTIGVQKEKTPWYQNQTIQGLFVTVVGGLGVLVIWEKSRRSKEE